MTQHPAYELMSKINKLVESLEANETDRARVIAKVNTRLSKADKTYVESDQFVDLVKSCLQRIETDTSSLYSQLKKILDKLKTATGTASCTEEHIIVAGTSSNNNSESDTKPSRKILKPISLDTGACKHYDKENYVKGLELFEQLINVIDDAEPNKSTLVAKLRTRLEKTEKKYLYSRVFLETLKFCINGVAEDSSKLFTFLRKVSDELKLNGKKDRSPHGEPTDPLDVSNLDEDEGLDDKTRLKIIKLEKTAKKILKIINKLENTEIDWGSDEDGANSAYIREDKYKQRYLKILEKIYELRGQRVNLGRVSQGKVKFDCTEYPAINRTLEKFYNKTREFPDYGDMLSLVQKVSETSGLGLSDATVQHVAEKTFTKFGEILKLRRQQEDCDIFLSRLGDRTDPAEEDEELARKLEDNKKHWKKIDDVINKYVILQEEKKKIGDDKDDEKSSTENEEEEDDEEEEGTGKDEEGEGGGDDSEDSDEEKENDEGSSNEEEEDRQDSDGDSNDSDKKENAESGKQESRTSNMKNCRLSAERVEELLEEFDITPCCVVLDDCVEIYHNSPDKATSFFKYLKLEKLDDNYETDDENEKKDACNIVDSDNRVGIESEGKREKDYTDNDKLDASKTVDSDYVFGSENEGKKEEQTIDDDDDVLNASETVESDNPFGSQNEGKEEKQSVDYDILDASKTVDSDNAFGSENEGEKVTIDNNKIDVGKVNDEPAESGALNTEGDKTHSQKSSGDEDQNSVVTSTTDPELLSEDVKPAVKNILDSTPPCVTSSIDHAESFTVMADVHVDSNTLTIDETAKENESGDANDLNKTKLNDSITMITEDIGVLDDDSKNLDQNKNTENNGNDQENDESDQDEHSITEDVKEDKPVAEYIDKETLQLQLEENEDVDEIFAHLSHCQVEVSQIDTSLYDSTNEDIVKEDADSKKESDDEMFKPRKKSSTEIYGGEDPDEIRTMSSEDDRKKKTKKRSLPSDTDSDSEAEACGLPVKKLKQIKAKSKKRKRSTSEEPSEPSEQSDVKSDDSSDEDFNPYEEARAMRSMREREKSGRNQKSRKTSTHRSPSYRAPAPNVRAFGLQGAPRQFTSRNAMPFPRGVSSQNTISSTTPHLPHLPGITLIPKAKEVSNFNLKNVTITRSGEMPSSTSHGFRANLGPASNQRMGSGNPRFGPTGSSQRPRMGPASAQRLYMGPTNAQRLYMRPTNAQRPYMGTGSAQGRPMGPAGVSIRPRMVNPPRVISQDNTNKTLIKGGVQVQRNALHASSADGVNTMRKISNISSRQRIDGSVHEQQIRMKHTLSEDTASGAAQESRVTSNVQKTVTKDGRQVIRKVKKIVTTNVEIEEIEIQPGEVIDLD